LVPDEKSLEEENRIIGHTEKSSNAKMERPGFVFARKRSNVPMERRKPCCLASMPAELAENTKKPATTMKEPYVVAMRQAHLKAQKPTGEEVEVAEVFPT
jgi:hypothetical protein